MFISRIKSARDVFKVIFARVRFQVWMWIGGEWRSLVAEILTLDKASSSLYTFSNRFFGNYLMRDGSDGDAPFMKNITLSQGL